MEYVICLLLLAAVFLLYRNRQYFEKSVIIMMILSLLSAVISELAFTFYISVYGFSNIVGTT